MEDQEAVNLLEGMSNPKAMSKYDARALPGTQHS